MAELTTVRREAFKTVPVRLSVWLSLAILGAAASWLTWHFMVTASLDGRRPSFFEAASWMFWMIVLAIVFIWACWVKTEMGWRWRWQRF